MPRTSSKISNTPVDSAPRAIKVEKPNAWEAVQRFFTARETRMVLGILLLTFSVIALLAYVSYLFTGTYDQSILSMDRPDRIANRLQIRNMLGLPGAMLAAFLIDGSFGFVSILLVLMVGMEASCGTKVLGKSCDISGEYGFIRTVNPHLYDNETGKPGLFAAGTCKRPMSVSDSINDARSAALAIKDYLDTLPQ